MDKFLLVSVVFRSYRIVEVFQGKLGKSQCKQLVLGTMDEVPKASPFSLIS